MSGRDPYDDDPGYPRRGRRRRAAPEDDPPGDGYRGARPSRGWQRSDPDTDPRTGSWPRRTEPVADDDRGDQQRLPRWEDTHGDRPRGRRHRGTGELADSGPATGPQPYYSAEGDPPRGRRRRSPAEEAADDHLAWSRPAPEDADDDFQPAAPRVLDFDSVPVRRKRARGGAPEEEPRGGRRRRSAESGAFPAVSDPDSSGVGEDRAAGRRRRSAESGAFPAVDEQDSPRPDPHQHGDEPRGGRRRRAQEPEDPQTAPQPRAPEHDGRPSGRRRSRRGDTGLDEGGGKRRRAAASHLEEDAETAHAERAPRRRGARTSRADRPRRGAADSGDEDGDHGGPHDRGDSGAHAPRRTSGRTKASRSGRSSRAQRGRGRRSRKGLIIGLSVALVAALSVGGYAGRGYLFPPDYEGEGRGNVDFTVQEGATGSTIAEDLTDEGVVASPRAFLNALGDHGGSVAPGTYELQQRMSGDAAVALLMDPASRVQAHVTFKEGLRSEEILDRLAEETGADAEDLRAAYDSGEGLGLPDYAEEGAEGYLFPDTYDVPADSEPAELLKPMVDRFHQVAEEVSLDETAEERDLTPNEAMSVAAIVQAESGSAEDMPKVARVVYNRLADDMELGMDSTCFYVLDEYGIALTNDQVQRCEDSGSEYATYGRKGLPSGPIASPGRDAIQAALNPAEGDWRYFVATDPENGVTEFATNYDEFMQLKQEFQQNRGDA